MLIYLDLCLYTDINISLLIEWVTYCMLGYIRLDWVRFWLIQYTILGWTMGKFRAQGVHQTGQQSVTAAFQVLKSKNFFQVSGVVLPAHQLWVLSSTLPNTKLHHVARIFALRKTFYKHSASNLHHVVIKLLHIWIALDNLKKSRSCLLSSFRKDSLCFLRPKTHILGSSGLLDSPPP